MCDRGAWFFPLPLIGVGTKHCSELMRREIDWGDTCNRWASETARQAGIDACLAALLVHGLVEPNVPYKLNSTPIRHDSKKLRVWDSAIIRPFDLKAELSAVDYLFGVGACLDGAMRRASTEQHRQYLEVDSLVLLHVATHHAAQLRRSSTTTQQLLVDQITSHFHDSHCVETHFNGWLDDFFATAPVGAAKFMASRVVFLAAAGYLHPDVLDDEQWTQLLAALRTRDGTAHGTLPAAVKPAFAAQLVVDRMARVLPGFRAPLESVHPSRRGVELSLALGSVDITSPSNGQTILHHLANVPDALQVAIPIAKEASCLNNVSAAGESALDAAFSFSNLQALTMLLDADVQCNNPWVNVVPSRARVDCIQLLVERGAMSLAGVMTSPAGRRVWSLHELCRHGAFELLFSLLSVSSDVVGQKRSRDERPASGFGMTPSFTVAPCAGCGPCTGVPLVPMDFNIADDDGWTAFQRVLSPCRDVGRNMVPWIEKLMDAVPGITPFPVGSVARLQVLEHVAANHSLSEDTRRRVQELVSTRFHGNP